jgi:hypothetical protein
MTPPITPIYPKNVKRAEAMMINPGWTCLDLGMRFEPQDGVTYLWVLTDDDRLVVGVENPWTQLNAFEPEVHAYLQEIHNWYQRAENKTEKDGYGGHPTLAGKFAGGDLYNSIGQAKIGGELYFSTTRDPADTPKRLIITNKSGRFGRAGTDDPTTMATIKQTLQHVVTKFRSFGFVVHARATKFVSKKVKGQTAVVPQHSWVL